MAEAKKEVLDQVLCHQLYVLDSARLAKLLNKKWSSWTLGGVPYTIRTLFFGVALRWLMSWPLLMASVRAFSL